MVDVEEEGCLVDWGALSLIDLFMLVDLGVCSSSAVGGAAGESSPISNSCICLVPSSSFMVYALLLQSAMSKYPLEALMLQFNYFVVCLLCCSSSKRRHDCEYVSLLSFDDTE